MREHGPGIEALLDHVSTKRYGLAYTAALRLGCCVSCRNDVHLDEWADVDRMEWRLSGLCPTCYRDAFPEGDE